jgi:hypothetical protein
MNILIFLLILAIIYLIYLNPNIKEGLDEDSSKNCIGGWLPWSTIDVSGSEICNTRTYKVLTPAKNGGVDCPYKNDERQELPCNVPKPDDCISIRFRYYGVIDSPKIFSIDASGIEAKKNKIEEERKMCKMENCIPATKVTSNCDSNIMKYSDGMTQHVFKRCPWVCDPKKSNDGDGINSCRYDSDCKKCSPINLIDNTNCGLEVKCPNYGAPDGCGYYGTRDTSTRATSSSSNNNIGSRLLEDIKIIESKEIDKEGKPIEMRPNINNYYDLNDNKNSDIYKSTNCYKPYNSLYNF